MVVFVKPPTRPHWTTFEEGPRTRQIILEAIKRHQQKARLLTEIAVELRVPVERVRKIILDDLFP